MGADKFTDTDFAHWQVIPPEPQAAPVPQEIDPETLLLGLLAVPEQTADDAEAQAAIGGLLGEEPPAPE